MANIIPIYIALAQNTDYTKHIAHAKNVGDAYTDYRNSQHEVGAYLDAETNKMHGDRVPVTIIDRLTQPADAFGSEDFALVGTLAPILTRNPYFSYLRVRAIVSESAKGEDNLEIQVTVYLNKDGRELPADEQKTQKASITKDYFKAMADINTLFNDQGYACGLTYLCATALGISESNFNSTFANKIVQHCARQLLGYYGMNVADVQFGLTAVIPVAN